MEGSKDFTDLRSVVEKDMAAYKERIAINLRENEALMEKISKCETFLSVLDEYGVHVGVGVPITHPSQTLPQDDKPQTMNSRVFDLLSENADKAPMRPNQIGDALNVPEEKTSAVRTALFFLVRNGKIYKRLRGKNTFEYHVSPDFGGFEPESIDDAKEKATLFP
jgi:hypothetical protein